jgi:hypothetical protein
LIIDKVERPVKNLTNAAESVKIKRSFVLRERMDIGWYG